VIYLVRHSIPEIAVKDGVKLMYGPTSPLSPEGELKARKLAQYILAKDGRSLEFIVSSPYKRAYQTACILAEEMQLGEVITFDGLVDTKSLWGGVPLEEITRVGKSVGIFNDPRTLETEADISRRIISTFGEITRQYPGRRYGIVSHGDPLRLLCNHLAQSQPGIVADPPLTPNLALDTAGCLRLEF
jgi:broad specificity phosphatase PhoE